MLKGLRNVILRSVIISAVVAGLTYGSYWICKGLAWASTQLTAILTQFGEFVKGNTPVLIVIIVVVMLFIQAKKKKSNIIYIILKKNLHF